MYIYLEQKRSPTISTLRNFRSYDHENSEKGTQEFYRGLLRRSETYFSHLDRRFSGNQLPISKVMNHIPYFENHRPDQKGIVILKDS